MQVWNFSLELFALIVLIIVSTSSVEKNVSRFAGKSFFGFRACVHLSFGVLAVETLADFLNASPALFPLWVRYASKVISLIVAMGLVPMFTGYIVRETFSLKERDSSIRTLQICQLVIFWLALLGLLIPGVLRLIYTVNADGLVTNGPLIGYNFMYMGVIVTICLIYMLLHRKETPYDAMGVCEAEIAVLYSAVLIKLKLPDLSIYGMIAALTALIILLSYQTRSIGTDSLTMLGNKISFLNEIGQRAQRNQPLSLCMLTLTNLDSINNALSYAKGDEALMRVTTWLRSRCPGALLYRYSPSSFVILNRDPDVDLNSLTTLLRNAFSCKSFLPADNFLVRGHFLSLSLQPGTYSPMRVVEALYDAKGQQARENRAVRHFDNSLLIRLDERRHLLDYIQHAIEEKRFEVYYQPIYCVATGTYETAEALACLKDRDGRFISPALFIPVAEDAGLCARIDALVLEQVCAFLGEEKDLPLRSVSVNLSLQDLRLPAFAEQLQLTMERCGVTSDRLELEITERMLVDANTPEGETLARLKAGGHHFLLDDFGTGFSNFASTLKYPLSKVKLDRSLIIENTDHSLAICRMLIDVFHRNGQQVVAEGIETAEQQAFFEQEGVDFVQGFYHARAMAPAEFADFLRRHRKGKSA